MRTSLLAVGIAGALTALPAAAAITFGTIANSGYITSIPLNQAVTLPSGVDGLVCGRTGFSTTPSNLDTMTWDSGGGTSAVGTLIGTARHSGGIATAFWWWDKAELPQGGATDTVTVTDASGGSHMVVTCWPIQTTNDNGISIANWDGDVQENGGSTISNVLSGAHASGALILQGQANSSQAGTTFTHLSTEAQDVNDAGAGGNSGAFAYEVNPAATTTFNTTGTFGARAAMVVEITEDAAAPTDPVWDTPPSVQSQTASAYTIAFDGGANAANVHCGAYLKDATTPTAAQIDAGTGAHGTATAALTGSSQTIVLTPTDSPVNPVYDVYCVAESAGGLYSLVADGDLLDEELDCPAGRNCQFPFASVDGTSPFDTAGAVAGDYGSIASITDPDAYATTLDTDATVWYSAFGGTTRQIIEAWNYDVSAADQTEYLFVFNNAAPRVNEPGDWPLSDALYEINADPGFLTEDFVADPEGDDIAWTIDTGAMPTDWVLNATTGVISDGTPGACGTYQFVLRATDEFGDILDLASEVRIGADVPDVHDSSEAAAIAAIEAVCSFTAVDGGTQCSSSIAAGNVVRTSPVAGALTEPGAGVTYYTSSGSSCPRGSSGRGFGLEFGLGAGEDE